MEGWKMRGLLRRWWIWDRRTRLWILAAVLVVISGAVGFAPRVPLGMNYHEFADQRTILGIPHGFDVLSNIPFVLVGMWGVVFLLRSVNQVAFSESWERIPYLVFFAGAALTGLGSGYYHLAPGNARLVWDLLPMTFSFVAIVDATIVERISTRAGARLLLPLMALGAASVAYWYVGELQAQGDLRFYLFVQFCPAVVIAVIIGLFPARYSRTQDLMLAFLFYVLAKLFELLDGPIYSLGRIVSGHTLKHITAALACYCILRMLRLRAVVAEGDPRRQWGRVEVPGAEEGTLPSQP
jgi:hypothetical protein